MGGWSPVRSCILSVSECSVCAVCVFYFAATCFDPMLLLDNFPSQKRVLLEQNARNLNKTRVFS